MIKLNVPRSTLQRLPSYLTYLRNLPKDAPDNISSASIAAALGLGEVQVRKDLAAVSDGGRPKIGYIVTELTEALEEYLGCNDMSTAVVVGAGKLGTALLDYSGFDRYGLVIAAGFDIDETLAGTTATGKSIFGLSKLENLCRRMNIRIGILTVPTDSAQSVCDLMIKSGILAILNFAPVHLNVPDNILVENADIAASLALLSRRLSVQMSK